jgi:hypothetical protein
MSRLHRDTTSRADPLALGIVVLEVAVRVGVVVLLGVLAKEIVTQDSDAGIPSIFIVPVVAYAAWSLGVIRWMLRWTARATESATAQRTATIVLGLAAVRLVWLVPLARDPWWGGTPTTALVVLTGIVIALTMTHRSKTSPVPALSD